MARIKTDSLITGALFISLSVAVVEVYTITILATYTVFHED